MELIKALNLGLRFLIEILALVIYGYWGFHVSKGTVMKYLLGIGTPLLVAVIWGMFGSPKAPYGLTGTPYLLFELIIFGLPAVALFFSGKQTWAILYGAVMVINLVLMKIWQQ
ncbi:YrdB family protein [Neobacillus niacini]|uniref:YrdB family protein n=1 Tax=Neobacillus niacini TaxID=86668 RepID=UPI0021CB5092|nr:YrdB family protein [Neobacillus niacini]MCM3765052.1 YrdB family protein [Neobacillus niacini]